MHELPGLYIHNEYLKDTIAQMGLYGEQEGEKVY